MYQNIAVERPQKNSMGYWTQGVVHLWDDEDEARLHKRVSSAVKRVEEILTDFRKVSDRRTGIEEELTME